jgi:hypothetical protein
MSKAWDSWKKQATDRRDARQNPDEPRPRPQTNKKKDTKRWCRGVEGRTHAPVWEPWQPYADWLKQLSGRRKVYWLNYTCTVCKKVLDVDYGHDRKYLRPKVGSTEPRQRRDRSNRGSS